MKLVSGANHQSPRRMAANEHDFSNFKGSVIKEVVVPMTYMMTVLQSVE